MRTQFNNTAFDRGYEAYGKYAVNPFSSSSVEYEQWEKGYLDAMDDEAYDLEDGFGTIIDVRWDDETNNIVTLH